MTHLEQKNIFAIPAGERWGKNPEDIFIIYAPLGGHISLGTADSVAELEKCAAGASADEAALRALAAFQAPGKVPVHYLPASPRELYQIDILSNYTCNFKCIYCYSAAGRSTGQIDFDHIKALIDYLFRPGLRQKNPYIINFSGGGEPLISFPTIKKTVEYIEKVTHGTDYRYNIGLVTNGSLVTPEIVDYLQRHQIDMAVSFEILQRLQDKERGSYDKVAANIDMMLDRGYPFGIRTTFTPESVDCMTEMIEEVHSRFPRLKKVVYDVVLAPSLFDTPADLEKYYDTFIDEYYKAKELARGYGITLESIAVETLSMIRDRTCEGKIVLTPVGTVSSCARISSPKEELYDEYTYGEVKDGRLTFDEEKFRSILNTSNIYTQEMCRECYARWNCGGGCRLFHHSFRPEFEETRCNFVRKALKRELINVLSDKFRQTTGRELDQYVKSV